MRRSGEVEQLPATLVRVAPQLARRVDRGDGRPEPGDRPAGPRRHVGRRRRAERRRDSVGPGTRGRRPPPRTRPRRARPTPRSGSVAVRTTTARPTGRGSRPRGGGRTTARRPPTCRRRGRPRCSRSSVLARGRLANARAASARAWIRVRGGLRALAAAVQAPQHRQRRRQQVQVVVPRHDMQRRPHERRLDHPPLAGTRRPASAGRTRRVATRARDRATPAPGPAGRRSA